MPASKPFLHPETLRRISRLELRAREVVEGYLSGMHRSPYFGQSVEFLQHREYTLGDDYRHVDWKIWAKHDRYYVKQFEEESNVRGVLLADVSASMSYGNGAFTKREYADTLAASLAYLMLRQQDGVGCITFDEGIRHQLPVRSRRNHLNAIVEALQADDPQDKTDLLGVLKRAADLYPRRSIIVLVSDLFVERDGLFQGLRQLRQRGHDVIVFHVMDDDELDFPFQGPTRFDDVELPRRLTCNPRALRAGYLEAVQKYLDEVRRGCAKLRVDYNLLRTSQSLEAALSKFLHLRMDALARRKR